MTKRGDTVRWLNEHVAHASDECLIWPFSRMSNGYANLRHKSKYMLAHRFMCQLVRGEPPTPEHQAAHSCGNGRNGCVNPKHLRWATQSENESDKIAHETSNRGVRNGRSKLSETEVLAIVEKRKSGALLKEIVSETGLHFQTVASICNGSNWAWLTGIRKSAA